LLDRFTDFLIFLGVFFPPIAGVMVAEYFVVKTHRAALEESRAAGRLPRTAPVWVSATIVVWAVSALVGKYLDWGIGSVNALVLAFAAYIVLGRLGLTRGVGVSVTDAAPEAPAPQPQPQPAAPARELATL
jgi:cytosine permease